MINKFYFLIIFSLFLSCNNKNLEGFYFEEKTTNIFEVKGKELISYNIIDSTSQHYKEYSFLNTPDSTSLIVAFSKKKRNVHLKKMNYKNKINSIEFNWFFKKGNKVSRYLCLNDKGNMYVFFANPQ